MALAPADGDEPTADARLRKQGDALDEAERRAHAEAACEQ